MIMHQIRHSGTGTAVANRDLEGRLRCHIQMTIGKQRGLARRVQALEDLAAHQNKRNAEERIEANPASYAHHQENWEALKSSPCGATKQQ